MILIQSIIAISEKYEEYSIDKNTANIVNLSIDISQLLHELQKERGLSAGYIGSKGINFKTQLKKQRLLTDTKIQNFQNINQLTNSQQNTLYQNILSNITNDIEQLSKRRQSIDQLSISLKQAISFYTELNKKIIHFISNTSNFSNDGQLIQFSTSFSNFVNGKELAGIERAVLNYTFSINEFTPILKRKFIELVQSQKIYFSEFSKQSNNQLQNSWQQILNQSSTQDVNQYRTIAFASDNNFQIKPNDWFKAATARINSLKDFENQLSTQLVKHIDQLQNQALSSLSSIAILTLIFVSLIIMLTFSISHKIIKQIKDINSSMLRVEKQSDLTCQAKQMTDDELGELALAFNHMLSQFILTIKNLTESSHQLLGTAESTAKISQQANSGIQQQQIEIEQVATAMNEMSATVQEVARNANNAATAATQAKQESREGKAQSDNTMTAINSLSEEISEASNVITTLAHDSENIGGVLEVIRGIADQTNLLALNAAIEAARAGEQGRGFAVVAEEVRTLAQRTQESTAEIQSMIEKLQAAASQAVTVMNKGITRADQVVEQASSTSQCLNQIDSSINEISNMNTQIADASKTQSQVAEEINRNISNIVTVIDESANGAKETFTASLNLAQLAQNQEDLVSKFTL
jgi:methyl-accepting chemotaxis protein